MRMLDIRDIGRRLSERCGILVTKQPEAGYVP